MTSTIQFTDLVWAVGLVAIAIALSAWQKLGLEGSLLIASVRTIVQLLAVGFLLEIVFQLQNPWVVLALLAAMVTIAAIVAKNRVGKKLPQLLPLMWGAIFLSTALTLIYTILLVVRPQTWYEPQSLIPLAGIVLGNSMNAAAIAGERFASTISSSQLEIETHLSLGATPHQAIFSYRQDAIKAGLIPTVNSMMVVGLVTLPGIITGQLLGGANPLTAAAYQILIMFMLAFSTLVTTILVIAGIFRQYFNQAAQLIVY